MCWRCQCLRNILLCRDLLLEITVSSDEKKIDTSLSLVTQDGSGTLQRNRQGR